MISCNDYDETWVVETPARTSWAGGGRDASDLQADGILPIREKMLTAVLFFDKEGEGNI